jgi:hypothetical protein
MFFELKIELRNGEHLILVSGCLAEGNAAC